MIAELCRDSQRFVYLSGIIQIITCFAIHYSRQYQGILNSIVKLIVRWAFAVRRSRFAGDDIDAVTVDSLEARLRSNRSKICKSVGALYSGALWSR